MAGPQTLRGYGPAMASYIAQTRFDIVHLHDYHVGLVPFYLGDDALHKMSVHFTIHNATYQGITPLRGGGYNTLDDINLPGERLFHKYFDFFDRLNLMKACMLKVHEMGGKITTVSGDLAGTWGYAAELHESAAQVWTRAYQQKHAPPGEVFVPNRFLDVLEKLPIAGITNGMSDSNRPEHLPELTAALVRTAMAINASWEYSARQYIDMYCYGLLAKQWYKARQKLIAHFTQALAHERELFATFFRPGQQEYGDRLDWELKTALDKTVDCASEQGEFHELRDVY